MFGSFMPEMSTMRGRGKASSIGNQNRQAQPRQNPGQGYPQTLGGFGSPGRQQFGYSPSMSGQFASPMAQQMSMGPNNMQAQQPQMGMGGMRAMMPSPQSFMQMIGQGQGQGQINNPNAGMRPGDLGNNPSPIGDMYRSGNIQTMSGPMQGGFRFA